MAFVGSEEISIEALETVHPALSAALGLFPPLAGRLSRSVHETMAWAQWLIDLGVRPVALERTLLCSI